MERIRFVAVFLLFFLPVYLLAQENGRIVCVFETLDLTEGTDANEDRNVFKQFFKDNMELELKNAGFRILSSDKWKSEQENRGYSDAQIIEGDKAMEVAAASGADVAITMFYQVDGSRILFGIKCYDVISKRLAVSELKNGRAGLSISSTINEVIADIIPLIKEKIQPVASVGSDLEKEIIIEEKVIKTEYEDIGKTIQLTLLSPDEGAEVFLVDENIGKIAQGRLVLTVQAENTLILDIKKRGYHTRKKAVDVGTEDMKVFISPLVNKTEAALTLDYSVFQFLGIGIGGRWYPLPDWWFLGLSAYPYFQVGQKEDWKSVLHGDLNLSTGYYIYFGPESPFRINAYIGGGAIFSWFTSESLPGTYIDFYGDLIGVTFEWNLPKVSFYLKEGGRYNLNLLGSGLLKTGWPRMMPVTVSVGGMIKW